MTRLIDEADWSDIAFESVSVGAKGVHRYRGRSYVTPGELAIARALHVKRIEFTPDVFVSLPVGPGLPFIYVPDFIFNSQVYVWTEPDGSELLIHGLEIKHRTRSGAFPPKGIYKTDKLYELRKIRVRLLCAVTATAANQTVSIKNPPEFRGCFIS